MSYFGEEYDLTYFRDIDKREVDFVVTLDKKPSLFVECKWNDEPISLGLKYLKSKFPACESWQISCIGTKDYVGELGIRVCPALNFLTDIV